MASVNDRKAQTYLTNKSMQVSTLMSFMFVSKILTNVTKRVIVIDRELSIILMGFPEVMNVELRKCKVCVHRSIVFSLSIRFCHNNSLVTTQL